MTEESFRARIYAIEWHADLWRRYEAQIELCEIMMAYCSECVAADWYGQPRPEPEGAPEAQRWQARMRDYFDELFSSQSRGPQSFE